MIDQYLALGWATIRVQPMGKAPVGNWKNRTDAPDDYLPGENVGIRLGDPSGGLVDLDLDCPESVALAPRYMPPTATFGRPSKPRSHWIYKCPGVRTHKPTRTQVELRSTGSQTVFPPSIHTTGEPITWATDCPPVLEIGEADLLAAFGRLCAATVLARAFPEAQQRHDAHDLVLALAGALWHEGWSCDDAIDLILPALELHGGPDSTGHREAAVRDTWDEHDRQRRGWPTVIELLPTDGKAFQRAVELVGTTPVPAGDSYADDRPLTDLGNAERLIDEHRTDLRYVPGLRWLLWDGSHWGVTGDPIGLMARSVRRLQRRGAETQQPAMAKWGFASESAGKLRAAITLAKDMPEIQTPPSELDADPWIMSVANGVVDLRTGELREHRREDMITRVSPTVYDPKATAPRFVQFLGEVFCGDWDLAAYVLRFLGYSLTGSVSEHIFQVWYGAGANGKSTLIDVVRHVLGDYAQILAADLLMERRNSRASEAASPDLARLRGARFAAGSETKPNQRWNESLVKQLTGGDRVVARELYSEPIEFEPSWKIILAVNHKPIVRGTDRGMWRRIHLVPFAASFEGARADRFLIDKLRAEASGILALLVQSCLQWQREGLRPPGRVLAAVDEYKASQDVIGSFVDECVEPDERATVLRSELYQAYRNWATKSGEYVHGKHAFNNELRDRGWAEDRRTGGVVWLGVRLKSEARFGAV